MTIEILQASEEVFRDLGFSPADSEKLRIKARLMADIEAFISEKGLTQTQAAEIMGVSRPRVSDVVRGKIDKFTIDALVDMLTKAGFQVEIKTTAA